MHQNPSAPYLGVIHTLREEHEHSYHEHTLHKRFPGPEHRPGLFPSPIVAADYNMYGVADRQHSLTAHESITNCQRIAPGSSTVAQPLGEAQARYPAST
jgi:hypothetical protein